MSRPNLEDLLDRYLAGQTTPEENQFLEQWLSDHYSNTSGWEDMNAPARKQWLDNLFDDITATPTGKADTPVIRLRMRNLWLRRMAATAAAILLLAGLYWLWHGYRPENANNALVTLRVQPNRTELLSLADGSRIWANAGAVLRYPQAFTGRKREVYLSGEAYFDIRHDAEKPFLVHTGKMVVAVLGTAFNIKADRSAQGITVTVLRGKVSVADNSHVLAYLTPGRQLRYNMQTRQAVQENVNTGSVVSWQDSEMHFEDITFEAAARLLEQRFSVSISFANEKLKYCRFYGTIGKGKNLDDILKILCAFNNAAFHRDQKGNIIITGQGCS